jgi:hypothetical protein
MKQLSAETGAIELQERTMAGFRAVKKERRDLIGASS